MVLAWNALGGWMENENLCPSVSVATKTFAISRSRNTKKEEIIFVLQSRRRRYYYTCASKFFFCIFFLKMWIISCEIVSNIEPLLEQKTFYNWPLFVTPFVLIWVHIVSDLPYKTFSKRPGLSPLCDWFSHFIYLQRIIKEDIQHE